MKFIIKANFFFIIPLYPALHPIHCRYSLMQTRNQLNSTQTPINISRFPSNVGTVTKNHFWQKFLTKWHGIEYAHFVIHSVRDSRNLIYWYICHFWSIFSDFGSFKSFVLFRNLIINEINLVQRCIRFFFFLMSILPAIIFYLTKSFFFVSNNLRWEEWGKGEKQRQSENRIFFYGIF